MGKGRGPSQSMWSALPQTAVDNQEMPIKLSIPAEGWLPPLQAGQGVIRCRMTPTGLGEKRVAASTRIRSGMECGIFRTRRGRILSPAQPSKVVPRTNGYGAHNDRFCAQ